MKICTIIGARPQFIKASAVSRAIRKSCGSRIAEVIVHTGQHYDYEMSQVFFDQLEIPKPDYHLGVGSGLHGEQTGKMLSGIEEILIKEKPDWVLVYGDTNSTLAGALAASKLYLKIAHVEAGLRSFNRKMPEEINRVVTDHLSTILFAPTSAAFDNLRKEGLIAGVYQVPDVMEEALYASLPVAEENSKILDTLGLSDRKYALSTLHRAENTDDPTRLNEIFSALLKISEDMPLVLPLHPRTKKKIDPAMESSSLVIIDPVSYLDMIKLEAHAKMILTDSGGVQKEAMWVETPCVTMRDETEWVETVEKGWNTVAGANRDKILAAYGKVSENIAHGLSPKQLASPDPIRASKVMLDVMNSLSNDSDH